jgi:sugar phosphate isomerase/epimerase
MKIDAASVPSLSRRDFVSMLALAGAAAPLSATLGRAQSAPVAAAAAPSVLHVFSKPFHQLSYAQTAKLVAAAGGGGIDYTVRVPQGHVLPKNVSEDLPRAIDAARAAGLKVEMITTEITSVRTPYAENVIRTAAKLGVKYYRLGSFNYDLKLGVAGTLEKIKPDFAELAALNASAGIHGAIQNHAGARVGSAIWDLYELLRGLDPRAIGVQYDIRHGTVEGAQSWPLQLRLLAPWIRCSDMKDFKWTQSPGKAVIDNVPLGEGIVPHDAYFKLVKELGIGGPISMHLEYSPFEKPPASLSAADRVTQMTSFMKKDLAVLKAVMAKNGVA